MRILSLGTEVVKFVVNYFFKGELVMEEKVLIFGKNT